MAKNQSNKTSQQGVCDRLIKNAANFTPFRKIYRSSHHSQSQSSANADNPLKAYVSQPKPAADLRQPRSGLLVPVDTPPKKPAKTVRIKDKFYDKGVASNDNSGEVDKDNFSEYIAHVRDGMRSASELGVERLPTKRITIRDSLNDKVSNFLNRARMKIRTPSSVGDLKSITFKGKGDNGH